MHNGAAYNKKDTWHNDKIERSMSPWPQCRLPHQTISNNATAAPTQNTGSTLRAAKGWIRDLVCHLNYILGNYAPEQGCLRILVFSHVGVRSGQIMLKTERPSCDVHRTMQGNIALQFHVYPCSDSVQVASDVRFDPAGYLGLVCMTMLADTDWYKRQITPSTRHKNNQRYFRGMLGCC